MNAHSRTKCCWLFIINAGSELLWLLIAFELSSFCCNRPTEDLPGRSRTAAWGLLSTLYLSTYNGSYFVISEHELLNVIKISYSFSKKCQEGYFGPWVQRGTIIGPREEITCGLVLSILMYIIECGNIVRLKQPVIRVRILQLVTGQSFSVPFYIYGTYLMENGVNAVNKIGPVLSY
jgi:hypothetical protein